MKRVKLDQLGTLGDFIGADVRYLGNEKIIISSSAKLDDFISSNIKKQL